MLKQKMNAFNLLEVPQDALDSVSYIKLVNYLGKHDSLGAVMEDSKISAADSMTRGKLFYELAKQYDDNNKVHDPENVVKVGGSALTSLTKSVKTDVDKNTVPGNAAAQKTLEDAFNDKTAHQSGNVAVAFLYKSQTQGVRDTEIRVHMKLSGGTMSSESYPKHVGDGNKIGRTWDQMCTPIPLMEDGVVVV